MLLKPLSEHLFLQGEDGILIPLCLNNNKIAIPPEYKVRTVRSANDFLSILPKHSGMDILVVEGDSGLEALPDDEFPRFILYREMALLQSLVDHLLKL